MVEVELVLAAGVGAVVMAVLAGAEEDAVAAEVEMGALLVVEDLVRAVEVAVVLVEELVEEGVKQVMAAVEEVGVEGVGS